MFELLPENVRKIAQKKYLIRLLTLYAIGFTAVFGISIALLTPSYVFVNLKESAIVTERDSLNKQSDTQGIETAKSFISSAKAKIASVDNSATIQPALSPIDLVLSKVFSGISVNSISFDRGESSKSKISLQGVASSRDDLIRFSERLKSESKFTKVDLPVSSFVKNKDASFSVNLEVSF